MKQILIVFLVIIKLISFGSNLVKEEFFEKELRALEVIEKKELILIGASNNKNSPLFIININDLKVVEKINPNFKYGIRSISSDLKFTNYVVGGGEGEVKVYNRLNNEVGEYSNTGIVFASAIDLKLNKILTGNYHKVNIYNLTNKSVSAKKFEKGEINLLDAYVEDIKIDRNQHISYIASETGFIFIFDNEKEVVIDTLKGQNRLVTTLALDEEFKILLASGPKSIVDVYDLNQKRLINSFDLKNSCYMINCLEIDLENNVFYTGDYKGNIKAWNLLTGEIIMEIGNHLDKDNGRNSVIKIKIIKEKNLLVSIGLDGYVKLWDISKLRPSNIAFIY